MDLSRYNGQRAIIYDDLRCVVTIRGMYNDIVVVEMPNDLITGDDRLVHIHKDHVKPLLRPLHSITDDEILELVSLSCETILGKHVDEKRMSNENLGFWKSGTKHKHLFAKVHVRSTSGDLHPIQLYVRDNFMMDAYFDFNPLPIRRPMAVAEYFYSLGMCSYECFPNQALDVTRLKYKAPFFDGAENDLMCLGDFS